MSRYTDMGTHQARAAMAAYLRMWRARANLTLIDVEQASDYRVKNSYLSRVESGRHKSPRLDVILFLIMLYDVPPKEVLEAMTELMAEGDGVSKAWKKDIEDLTAEKQRPKPTDYSPFEGRR